HAQATEAIESRYAADKKAVKSAFQEVRWTIAAVLEGSKNDAETHLKEVQGRIAQSIQRVHAIQKEMRGLLQEWKQDPEDYEQPEEEAPEQDTGVPLRNLQQCIRVAEKQLTRLKGL